MSSVVAGRDAAPLGGPMSEADARLVAVTSSEVFPSRAFDGRRRLPLMVTTDLLQAVLLLSIPLLWWLGLLSLPAVLLIVLAYGTVSVVNVAAAMSLLPRLVEPQHLQPAHARIDGADAVSMTARAEPSSSATSSRLSA